MRNILIFFLGVTALNCIAQNSKSGNGEGFRLNKLSGVIMAELNRFRASKGLDTLEHYEMMASAADMSAQDLADNESEKTDPTQTQKYLKEVGATQKGTELTMKAVISKGREDFTTEEIARVIYTRWENNEKNLAVL